MWYNVIIMSNKDQTSVRKRGVKELIGGVVLAAVTGIISYISYDTAKAGETYTVYYGGIALGIVYAVKGLYDIAFPAGFSKQEKSTNPAEIIDKAEPDQKDKVVEED